MPIEDILLTVAELNAIKDKAPSKLPLNPTPQGYSGQEIRRQLDRYVIDNTDSVLSLLETKLGLVKDAFEEGFQQVWFFEATDPTNDDGKPNDFWLNTVTMDVFLNVENAWVLQGNIRGIQGFKGVSLRILGEWNPLTSYVNDSEYQDVVHYDGASYYCKISKVGNSGNTDPITDTTTWGIFTKQGTSFRHRGEWNEDISYYNDEDHVDVVTYLGDLYYAKESITGTGNDNPLTDNERWGVYSEKGISFRQNGAWVATNSYVNDSSFIDVVTYNGKSYNCILSIVGNSGNNSPAVDTTHWTIFLDNTMSLYSDGSATEIAYTLQNNAEKTFTQASPTTVEVTIPSGIAHGFIAGINFNVGASVPTISFVNSSGFTLKRRLYNYTLSSTYVPTQVNCSINMMFWCDGIYVYCQIVEVD